jgi:hypothetical protein
MVTSQPPVWSSDLTALQATLLMQLQALLFVTSSDSSTRLYRKMKMDPSKVSEYDRVAYRARAVDQANEQAKNNDEFIGIDELIENAGKIAAFTLDGTPPSAKGNQ